jgi:uncharacterized protein (TIGR02265 family)
MREMAIRQPRVRVETSGPVPRRDFDGLFGHVLRPEGAFASGLRAVGYDPDAPLEHYPLEVWRKALEVARLHVHPQLSRAEAYRRLGRQFVQGFAQTVVGRVFAAAASLIGAEHCLARLPTYLRAGRSDMHLELRALGPRSWRALVQDPAPLPAFVAGVIEEVLRLTGVQPRVEVESQAEAQYSLAIRWETGAER